MSDTTIMEAVRSKYQLLQPLMTERLRRQWAACEAESLGRGGVSLVARATDLSRTTIWAGRGELRRRADQPQDDLTPERVRAPGGGRHLIERNDTAILTALRDLVESSTRGDPQSPWFWTSKSTRTLAEELTSQGHPVSHQTVAAAEGVYDLRRNEGWVSVGVDHDTAEFAVESICRWWQEMGAAAYPRARRLLVTADAGGSNGYRSRLWKVQLQGLSDDLGLRISVCHFPPGTSKWNKIEHRMCCHITQNWRGRPLRSRAIVVNLISHTTTKEGLRVQAELDTGAYRKGIKVSDKDLAAIQLERASFHGEWNYTITPRR